MIAHEIYSAAALIAKQSSEGIPAAIVRGVKYRECECGLRDSMPRINYAKVLREIIRESIKTLGIRKTLKTIAKLLIG